MTQWWSDSKGKFVDLSEMPSKHLSNAWKKVMRGDYVPPAGPLSADEGIALTDAIKAELDSRGCGLDGVENAPAPTDDDAPRTEEL